MGGVAGMFSHVLKRHHGFYNAVVPRLPEMLASQNTPEPSSDRGVSLLPQDANPYHKTRSNSANPFSIFKPYALMLC